MVKTHKKYQDYLWNPVVNTFHLDPTNIEEVQSCIKTLNACVHYVLLIFFFHQVIALQKLKNIFYFI